MNQKLSDTAIKNLEVKQRVFFIGLGMMGYPMAARLSKAGYQIWVADADAARVKRFANEHGATALTVETIDFPDIDVVVTMLPGSVIVEEVILGKGDRPGLLSRLKTGAIVIDMSTSEPLRSRELSATLLARHVNFLDAPVSGGVKRAIDGSLAIMVGGDKKTFESCSNIFHHLGKNLFHVGDAGAGHAVKAINNYVSASGLVAAVDAMHIGERFGIDPAVTINVLNASSGRNNATENKANQFMLNGKFDSGFSLQLMVKDLGIAVQLAKGLGYCIPLGEECLELWANEAEKLDRVADHTEMYHLLDRNKQGVR